MCAEDLDLVARLGHQRGPEPGEGRSHGLPWRGIVEETPAVWVTWVVEASRRAGLPVPSAVMAAGVRVTVVSVALTYGLRYYFRCPDCGRRCEALYLVGRSLACRKCQRLGYRSQKYRPTSCYAALDRLFARTFTRDGDQVDIMADELRRRLEAGIDTIIGGNDEDNGT